MKKKELTARCFMEFEDGRVVPMEELTEEEKEYAFSRMRKRLSRVMSLYYSEHLDEFERLKDISKEPGYKPIQEVKNEKPV